MMSKADYQLIARTIHKSREYAAAIEGGVDRWGSETMSLILLELLSSAFQHQDPDFDRAQFMRTASLDETVAYEARSLLERATKR